MSDEVFKVRLENRITKIETTLTMVKYFCGLTVSLVGVLTAIGFKLVL